MGEIPRELAQSGSVLTEVWLHNNLLSGTVPAAFADIPTLKNLYVDGESSIVKAGFDFSFFWAIFDSVFSRIYCQVTNSPEYFRQIYASLR